MDYSTPSHRAGIGFLGVVSIFLPLSPYILKWNRTFSLYDVNLLATAEVIINPKTSFWNLMVW